MYIILNIYYFDTINIDIPSLKYKVIIRESVFIIIIQSFFFVFGEIIVYKFYFLKILDS
jgi:hypothetical protein